MKIDDKTVEYVAALAKLELSGEEGLTRERARTDLERILAYMETMNELDTEGIEPMSHVLPLKNVFREDVVQVADRNCYAEQAEATAKEKHQMESVETTERMGQTEPAEIRGRNRERLLSNAPLQKDGCFVVPKTVE